MKSIQLSTHINNNGLLQLKLPPEFSGLDVDVVLVIQERQANTTTLTQQNWQDFVNGSYGCFADEPLTRPDELPLAVREELL